MSRRRASRVEVVASTRREQTADLAVEEPEYDLVFSYMVECRI